MKTFKSEKGVITMITLITVVFMISFLITSFIVISNKVKTQKEILAETKAIYEPKLTMEEIYNSQFNYESVIPIYTVEQLLSIGSNKKINIDGKVYTFSNTENIAYLLKNDLEFNAIDLNLENDWIPMYENSDFLGNFDWNGHTIKVTTLSGDIIIYDATYLATSDGYPITLSNAVRDNLLDYKIYGNSVQNGDPSPNNPVEIQSVGDTTINLLNPNAELEKIGAYLGINTTGIDKGYTLKIQLREGKTVPEGIYFGFVYYRTETSTGASADWLISAGSLNQTFGDGTTYALTTFNPSEYYKTGICCHSGTQENWDKVMNAFDIYWVEGTYTNATIPEEPYGKYKIPIKVSNRTNETTTNIYLDEPLRKIGEYSDYIDFENKVVVRNIAKLVFDGSEDENWGGPVAAYNGYSIANTILEDGTNVMCNIAIGSLINQNTIISVRKNYNAIRLQAFSNIYETLDSFKQFLSETNVIIEGKSATQGIEPIELPNIQLNKGKNTITVDTQIQPSNMSVTYNAKQ